MKYNALRLAYEYCLEKGMTIPYGLKTADYYYSVIKRLVRNLYRGYTDALEFVQIFYDLIFGQLTRAWNEGMAENGVEEMTEEWQAQLDGIIESEKSHVEDFATEIDQAGRQTGEPIDPYLDRVDLWAARYEDVVNQAKLATAGAGSKFRWVYGDTEHCGTCEKLNNIVAFASEWEESGFHPQQPPNGLLECGGWRCQCVLEQTTDRRSANALTRLLDIATGQNV